MKKQSLFKWSALAFSLIFIGNMTEEKDVSAFTIGGGANNNSCTVMKKLNHKDNYMVSFQTDSGLVELPLLAQFDGSCAKTKALPWAMEHVNGKNGKQNVFVLRRVGNIVVYQPDLGEYDYVTMKQGSMSDISWDGMDSSGVKGRMGNIGWNRHGTSFLSYSVPFNNTSCGYQPKKGETGMSPVCNEGDTYYEWGHFLKNNTNTNRQKLAHAININDMDTIEALTGEWEYAGYSWDGTVVHNPYFPSDYPVRYYKDGSYGQGGSGKPNAYPWYSDPYSWGTVATQFDDAEKGEALYSIKYEAISNFKTQEDMSGSIDSLMKKFSLKNDYRYSAAILEGRGTTYTGTDGKTKRFYNIVMVESNANALNNMALMRISLWDGDKELLWWERKAPMNEDGEASKSAGKVTLEGGKEYTLKMIVLNDSTQALTLGHQVNLELDAKEASVVSKEDDFENEKTAKSSSAKMNKGALKDVTTKITIPEVNGKISIDAILDEANYSQVNHWKIDDKARIDVNVETKTGDISVCGIKVFEKGGSKELSEKDLVQDREYDVKYHICYKGATMKGAQEINVTGTLATTGKYHQEVSLDRTLNLELKDNSEFVITETIRLSNPEIITDIKISTNNEKINTDETNDTGSRTLTNAPNIILTDLKITPEKIEFTPVGCHVVTVSYNLTLADVKQGYNSTFDTTTRIIIGTKNYDVTDKIKAGTHRYTHNVEYCFPSGDEGGTRDVIAEANKNQGMFESNINDNKQRIDWVGVSNAERNGCPVSENVSNEVTWNQEYTIDKVEVWMENGRLMQKVVSTEKKSVENQTESFKITTIQMRSKLQQDLGLGQDGWVDVIEITDNGTQQIATPKIKAGYGFELRVKAEYTTNVLSDAEQTLDVEKLEKGEKQTIYVVSAGSHDKPNLVNDFYINVASAKLNVGSGLDLVITPSTTNENSKVFDVTITPKQSPNTNEANDNRLYISENTADGTYKMKFFTPAITGLTSRTDKSNVILCDEMEINFDVVGSVYDDLNTHQTK